MASHVTMYLYDNNPRRSTTRILVLITTSTVIPVMCVIIYSITSTINIAAAFTTNLTGQRENLL